MILRDEEKLSVQGPVTIANVVKVIRQGINLFDQNNLVIDLTHVTEVDSSAVSMLLEWQRKAQKDNRQIYFTNMPENLKNLTQLYGVAKLVSQV